MYYRIGDLSRELDEVPHVIRFWESEFRLTPLRSKKGQRVYNERQVARLRLIRFLLREELYSIPGAKRQLQRLQEWAT